MLGFNECCLDWVSIVFGLVVSYVCGAWAVRGVYVVFADSIFSFMIITLMVIRWVLRLCVGFDCLQFLCCFALTGGWVIMRL